MLSNWVLNFATFTHMPWCFNVSIEDILSLIQIAFKSCLMAGIPQNPTADEVIEMGCELQIHYYSRFNESVCIHYVYVTNS